MDGLIIYNTIAEEIGLFKYTLFEYVGICTFVLLALRKVLVVYIKNINLIEAITFSLIYIKAITSYNNELDGMLFVLLIVGLMILSYIQKYNSLFIISISAILVNIFLLTREFWFSIPWWVYLLLLGSLLILFAIRNEMNDNGKKINIETIVKALKDRE